MEWLREAQQQETPKLQRASVSPKAFRAIARAIELIQAAR